MTMLKPTRRSGLLGSSLLASALLCSAVTAHAQDSEGKISSIMLDEQNYMGLRIKLSGISSFCSGGAQNPHVAYVALDHPLYETILRVATSAYLAGKEVTVRATKNGTFCRVTGLFLQD
jgi:hypothetical protein